MNFERSEHYREQQTEIRVMWPGGPSRLCSDEKGSRAAFPYCTGGYVGVYVCQACGVSVAGVYRSQQRWLCAGCFEAKL
jgi:hypothetical protein